MKSGMQVIMILNLTIFPYKWLKFKCCQLMLVFFFKGLFSSLPQQQFYSFYFTLRRGEGGGVSSCKVIFKSLEFYSHNINLHLGLKCLCCKSIFKSLRTKTNWVRVLEFRSHNMYLHLDIKCFLTIFKLVQGCASIPQIFRNSLDFGGG